MDQEDETVVVTSKPKRKTSAKAKATNRTIPRYHVVLLDDDDHSYEYVVNMLSQLFGHEVEKAFLMACEVDSKGRVIVDTTSKERAELKRDQIHAFGADPLLSRSVGSMSAVIEPAE